MNQREQLIEDAAKAMADASPDGGWNRLNDYERGWYRRDAEAALSVFEGAYTPTDDELLDAYNHAVDAAMHRVNERDGFGSSMSRESIVSGLRAVAGFHRTVQGEPSEAQVVAALNTYWAYDPPIVDPAYWSEKHKGIMRAALRAAAETGGEHRG